VVSANRIRAPLSLWHPNAACLGASELAQGALRRRCERGIEMPKIGDLIATSLAESGEASLLIAEGQRAQAAYVANLARKVWQFIRSL
jgi:hypothetical protein